jgi:hypothetical protein
MLVETQFHDPFGPLRDGQIDVLAVSLPVREPGLTVGPVIIREGQVLVVPVGHPMADHESASVEVLADYPVHHELMFLNILYIRCVATHLAR